MARFVVNNNAGSTLASDIAADADTFTLADGSGFASPSVGELSVATLHTGNPASGEVVYYASRTGNVFSGVLRGRETAYGTGGAQSWDAGTVVEQLGTAGMHTELVAAVEAKPSLGETSTTAYAGDKGKTAYDHSQAAHDKTLVGLANVTNNAQVRLGTTNTDIDLIKTLFLFADTRSFVATAWDVDDRPTTLEIRDGVDVVADITITYNADGKITELAIADGAVTVTYTLTWDGNKFVSQTKAVI